MVGAVNRTHIPHRPWSVHCEIEEGVPKPCIVELQTLLLPKWEAWTPLAAT